MNTKIIAYYLPQYHRVKENDQWWGEGFTEWTHVRNGKPLFSEHNQPRVPYGENYYNLMDKETVEWQSRIAEEYGIYGFAYYHYWFEGRLLLEKPAENLLLWKDVNQKFFFFWANHSWYKAENGKKELLLEQNDGGATDWKNHYNYLRNFFKDDRYIKINNKPVFGIYDTQSFSDIDSMIKCWSDMAKKDGFDGVFIIENKSKKHQKKKTESIDAMVCRQPLVAMNTYNLKLYKRVIRKIRKIINIVPKKPQLINYQKIAKLEKEYEPQHNDKEYLGVSVGWDNTPRHGVYGQVFVGESVEKFRETLKEVIRKSKYRNNEFLFINAWNEWAEGMYLEPDQKRKYSYLEAIKEEILND